MLVKSLLRTDLYLEVDSNTYYSCDPGEITDLLLAANFIWKRGSLFPLGLRRRSSNTCEMFPGPDTRRALRNGGCYDTTQLCAYCWYLLPPNSEKRLQRFRSRDMAARFEKAIVKQTSGCFRKTTRIHAMFFNYETYSGFVNFSQMAEREEDVSLRSQSEWPAAKVSAHGRNRLATGRRPTS